ncbi:uncharacterized protein B0H18DRAFT_978029, partial [Fomitopsis serialis]|uniref:uncharacterized protein n=1 Tax=Fomitopsis serialis TaxID=139415 RepID=UPI002008837F
MLDLVRTVESLAALPHASATATLSLSRRGHHPLNIHPRRPGSSSGVQYEHHHERDNSGTV